ncbi:MAG: hypothetical protein V1921_01475 [Candidatus Altiarchaeota archaeon]
MENTAFRNRRREPTGISADIAKDLDPSSSEGTSLGGARKSRIDSIVDDLSEAEKKNRRKKFLGLI